MKLHAITTLVVAALCTGCAATGVKHQDMAASIPTLNSEKGRIYVYRDASFVGAAIQPAVMLNGVKVGVSQPGGFFYVDSPAGNQELSCSTEVERKLIFTLEKGEEKYVKTSIGFGVLVGRVIPDLVDKEKAKQEIKDLSFTGTAPASGR